MVKKLIPYLLVVFLSIVSGYALLHTGLPPTHDGEYHVIRFYEFDKAIRDGDWYPRWAQDLNFGYGVPLFNFVYPLPNYVAFFFHMFGASFIDSFKLNLFFATLLSGVFFFQWAKIFWGVIGGIVASAIYLFSPYRFLDIYIRGSVGEVWALTFFPACLWAGTQFIQRRSSFYGVLFSVFLALTIFSHNILSLMFFPFVFLYIVSIKVCFKSSVSYFSIILFTFIGCALAAIFWIPALSEKQYTVGLQVFGFQNHFTDLSQLLIPSWGSGFSSMGGANQMSFQIGIMNLLAVFLSIIVLFKLSADTVKRVTAIFFIFFLVSVFFMLKSSEAIWNLIPLMSYFQFPWRFLSIVVLTTAFLAGSISQLSQKFVYKMVIGILFIGSAILLTKEYAKPAHYLERNDSYYISRSNFIDGTNSPGNAFNTLWASGITQRSDTRVSFEEEKTPIKVIEENTSSYVFLVQNPRDQKAVIHTAYFPGWHAYINDSEVPLKRNKNGWIQISIPEGQNKISLRFENTPIRTLSILISCTAGMILLITLFRATIIKQKGS